MAAALAGADAAQYAAPGQGTLAGRLLETFVVMEVSRVRRLSAAAARRAVECPITAPLDAPREVLRSLLVASPGECFSR